MRNHFLIGALALTVLFGGIAVGDERSIETDNLVIGKRSGSTNPSVQFRGTTQSIRANTSTNKLQFSNDGSTFKNLGSGAGGDGGINLLSTDNADFELGISSNWTNSGGSYTALSGAGTALFDLTSARFNASATDQTVTSDGYDVPAGLYSGKCLGSIKYKTSESTNKYKLIALDGDDSTVLAEQSLDSTNSLTITGYVPFTCPSAGTVKLQIKSTGDAADIDIDNAHLGSDIRVADISQATLYGAITYAGTSNCEWTTGDTGGSFTAFGADTDCPAPTTVGSASAPATKVPAITFATLPPGEYQVVVLGTFVRNTTTTVADQYYRIYDGSTYSGVSRLYEDGGNDSPTGNLIVGRFR